MRTLDQYNNHIIIKKKKCANAIGSCQDLTVQNFEVSYFSFHTQLKNSPFQKRHFQIIKDFDDSLTNMNTKSHSMYQELLVSTSECNQQSFLDQISVPLSRVFLCVPHTLMRGHLFGTLTIV